jgi:hypothetical protein
LLLGYVVLVHAVIIAATSDTRVHELAAANWSVLLIKVTMPWFAWIWQPADDRFCFCCAARFAKPGLVQPVDEIPSVSASLAGRSLDHPKSLAW